MTALLSLANVETHIAQYHILHGVDLMVPEGQTTMLLGRNGAGKTTTLRTIMGLWRASRGEISLAGTRIETLATPDIARLGIAYVPESMAIFADLTVQENLILAARSGPPDSEPARDSQKRRSAGKNPKIHSSLASSSGPSRAARMRFSFTVRSENTAMLSGT